MYRITDGSDVHITVISILTEPTFDNEESAQPCTVLTFEGDVPTLADAVQALFRDFDLADDVWSWDLSQSLVVQLLGTDPKLTEDGKDGLRRLGVKALRSFRRTSSAATPPQGTYFLHHGHLHQAYRLCPDPAGAFIVSTVPDDNAGFRSLDAAAYDEQFPSALTVPVHSRLYYKKLRFAIKNIIDLKGLKTRASLAPTPSYISPKRGDCGDRPAPHYLGFVIVGRLKSTQFADSEW